MLTLSFDETAQQIIKMLSSVPAEEISARDPVSGCTVLFSAVQRRSDADALQIATFLLDSTHACGADDNDANRQTALFFAARDGQIRTCEFLMTRGANPSHTDTAGQTALFYAARDGRCEVLQLLERESLRRNHLSIVNAADKVGQTALFYAAREGQMLACEALLSMGADPNKRDWQKKLASTYAYKNKHTVLATWLKQTANRGAFVPPARVKVKLQFFLADEDAADSPPINEPCDPINIPADLVRSPDVQQALHNPLVKGEWLFADSRAQENFCASLPEFQGVWSNAVAKPGQKITASTATATGNEAGRDPMTGKISTHTHPHIHTNSPAGSIGPKIPLGSSAGPTTPPPGGDELGVFAEVAPIDGFVRTWSKRLFDILVFLSHYKEAVWFMKPVDAATYPDYYSKITDPTCMEVIMDNLKWMKYARIEDCLREINSLWENCFAYNPANSPVHQAGQLLQSVYVEACDKWNLNTFKEREHKLIEELV